MKEKIVKTKYLMYTKATLLKNETKKHVGTAIAAAFAFLIALAWRDAISEIINLLIASLNLTSQAYVFQIISALLITVISVIGILVTAKITTEPEINKDGK